MTDRIAQAARSPEDVATTDRNLALLAEFVRAMVDDPALQEEIPDGAALALLPDDDPALTETNIALGLRNLRNGHNVYFRHVHREHGTP